MVTARYFLGIDQGTQSTKSVLFDRQGFEIQSCAVPVALHHSAAGLTYQEPDEIFSSLLKSIRSVMRDSGISPAQVAAVSVDSRICSMVVVDKDLNPVGKIISHLDTCSNSIRDQLLAAEGERILSQNGSMPYIASRLLWLKRTHPEKFRQADRVLLVGAYCSAKLCGLTGEDAYADKTTMNVFGWGDLRTYTWDQELASDLGISMDLSPTIKDPLEVIGEIQQDAAESCGLLSGTPVLAGTGDAIAGWIGLGADQTGIMVDTSGTANHLCFCVPEFKADLDARVLSYYPSVSEELGFQIGFTAGTGKSHRWGADILQGKPPYQEDSQAVDAGLEELDEEASKIPPGSDGVMFIPHFGGRACPPLPHIKGAWVGLEWHHSRAHLYRAVLESIAYEYARYLDRAKEMYPEESFREFYTVGGGSKSPLWTQIKSDVMGVPGKIMTGAENLAARGSALLAAQAVGEGGDFLASRYRHKALDIKPDAENTALYSQYQSAYLDLTDHLAEALLEKTYEPK